MTPSASCPTWRACSGVEMPNPTASGRPGAARAPAAMKAASSGGRLARAGHPGERDQVEESAGLGDDRGDALGGRGGREQVDQRQPVLPAGRGQLPGFFRRQVGDDQAIRAGRLGILAEALQRRKPGSG